MTSVLRFSDSFWDEQDRGVDILTEKLASSEQTCRDLKTIYEARAQIEKEYGQKLLELSQYTIGKVELGTLADSIQRIPKAFESTGKAHIDMAEQLKYSLEAPLESFLKEQSEIIDARTHQIENSKKLKDIHLAHVEKAKQAYDEANQLLKQKEQNGEDIESTKYSLAMADRQWKSAVENLQEVRDKFTLDWRITCDLYQDLEERRINFIRSNLWAFANMMSSVFIVDDRGCEGIRTGLEMTDVRKDINDFILKYGTSVKITDGSPQSVHNEIIKSNDDSMTDAISSAFQDVENLLSDTASNERHSIISTTSSMDQYSAYSHSPKNNINRSSLASIHSPLDNENSNNNKIKENTIVMESPTYPPSNVNTGALLNRSQPPSPPLPTSKKVPTPTKQSPLKGNGMNHNTNNNSDDDDDDDRNEIKLPLRAPKPKEEKWTISTRKNKTASMIISPPPKNNNGNNESATSSKRNSFVPNTMSSSSSSSSLQIPPPKKSYLNPSVHPPPLKQSTSQPNIGLVSSASQSAILYPPENSHFGTNPASVSNNISPVYIIAPSSASTTSLVLNHNYNHNNNSNNSNNNNNNQYSSQVYPPYNQPVNNYSPTSHPPSTGNQNINTAATTATAATTTTTTTTTTTYPPSSTTYQPVMTNQPATITSSYRPIVRPTSPNHHHSPEENSSTIHQTSNNYYPATTNQNNTNQQQQQQIIPSVSQPQIIKPSSNDQHTKNNYSTTNQPTTTNYSQANPAINNNNHSTTTLAYQPQINQPLPSKNEQPQPNIGIRPPKWEEKPAEINNIVASEYKRDEKDIGDSSAKSGGGLQRYNSVSGPREPPSKGNFIHSSELKNTHGVGEETVAILKNEQEATTTTIDTNLNKDHSDNSKPTSSSSSTQESSSSTQPSSSKSGFSFNNIFFKKDKPAAATEDEKRILSDGTPYKHKARAIWGYEAKIPSELSFQANDMLAVIRKQPDGWWEAEILDEQRKQRGLVIININI
ncbi:hypothetical protein BJ944DRAFT_275491 [Cunninghamella echinulata]|nr:hypothetical protein BJ944DRAFT_275491 [Cunninghamella echinulata]